MARNLFKSSGFKGGNKNHISSAVKGAHKDEAQRKSRRIDRQAIKEAEKAQEFDTITEPIVGTGWLD